MPNKSTMGEWVGRMLETQLPATYYYHNAEHTRYVVDKALEIARHENCTAEETRLIEVAAWWHDTGFLTTYANHEEAGCILAKAQLPGYGFANGEINIICGMIMATKIPQTPINKLEAILADADLEYLGTATAAIRAEWLLKEIQSITPTLTRPVWNRIQISFLQAHHYFTGFCRLTKEPVKQAYLQQLIAASK